MDEIQNLIPSFRACIMTAITTRRQQNGDLNTVAAFAADIIGHRTRYAAKLESIRIAHPDAATRDHADAAEQQIATITDREIARARQTGRVEFEAA